MYLSQSCGMAERLGDLNDDELIALVRAGDKNAFTALYRSYFPEIWSFARRYVKDSAIAEDLVQDVFLNIWARHSEFKVNHTVRSYLYTAVRNRALKSIRHSWIRGRAEPTLIAEYDEWNGPESSDEFLSSVQGVELKRAVARAVSALPEKQQVVMGLKLGRGLNAVEIAEVLGVSPQAVSKTIQRAQAALQDLLRNFVE